MSEPVLMCKRLCAKGHVQIGLAYFEDKLERETVEKFVLASLKTLGVNPWCGLCFSREFHFEHGECDESTPVEAAAMVTPDQIKIFHEHEAAKRNN